MNDSLTCGMHHVGLAVPDLHSAETFFRDALGWKVTRRLPEYPAVFVSDGKILVTLWRVADPGGAAAFDRRANIGLHHLALGAPDLDGLSLIFRRVSQHPGVNVEFEPEPIRPGSSVHHFICAMPGGVRIEFATPVA